MLKVNSPGSLLLDEVTDPVPDLRLRLVRAKQRGDGERPGRLRPADQRRSSKRDGAERGCG